MPQCITNFLLQDYTGRHYSAVQWNPIRLASSAVRRSAAVLLFSLSQKVSSLVINLFFSDSLSLLCGSRFSIFMLFFDSGTFAYTTSICIHQREQCARHEYQSGGLIMARIRGWSHTLLILLETRFLLMLTCTCLTWHVWIRSRHMKDRTVVPSS